MVEHEDVEVQRNLANGLFAWLQMVDDTLPPPLNSQARQLLEQLSVERDQLPELRSLINEMDASHVLPLRIYVSGFDEDVVRQLDSEGVFDEAQMTLYEACVELFEVATPVELFDEPEEEEVVVPEPEKVVPKRTNRERTPKVYSEKKTLPAEEPSEEDLEDAAQLALAVEDIAVPDEVLKSVALDSDLVKQYFKEAGKYALLSAEQEVEISKAIEAGLLALERLEAQGQFLSNEEREELEYLVGQGQRSNELMLQSNLRLVISIARRYSGRGLQLLDLIQEGNLGLIRAVEKFDYEKGYKFSTYATWWIRQAITRAMADKSRTIRIPVHMVDVIRKTQNVERQMESDLGRLPTTDELAKELDMAPEKVIEIKKYGRDPISLHTPLGEEGDSELSDLIEDSDSMDVADQVLLAETSSALNDVLETFSEREQLVVRMRMGLIDGQPKTLDQVSAAIGVTRQRAQQIEAKTMSKLRHPSRAHLLAGLKRSRES